MGKEISPHEKVRRLKSFNPKLDTKSACLLLGIKLEDYQKSCQNHGVKDMFDFLGVSK